MKFGTKAIHAGITPDESTGAIMTPIYQTSTYVQTAPGEHKGFEYSRTGNPTRATLENQLALLENAKHGFCFGSGLASIDCVLKLLNPGDEVISCDDLYGGSHRIFTQVYAKYGIKFRFINMHNIADVVAAITDKTKLVWAETPTNPLLNIIDIEAIANITKPKGILFAVDNTFATPYGQTPISLGADIVSHSITKYLGGHSDVVMGALVCNDDKLAEDIFFIQNSCGAVCGPMDSFLVLRGIKTLHLRMKRHAKNAKKVAKYLREHPKVDKVYWPGFEDHPNHDIAKNQMRNFGGMVSFTLKGDDLKETLAMISKTKIFSLAESLGGVESLVGHPASMTHAAIPYEERQKTGVLDSLVRLSVGIESASDLIADLEQAIG
jgi:cystathionine beta-lyase